MDYLMDYGLWIDASLLVQLPDIIHHSSIIIHHSLRTRVMIWSPEFESGLMIRNLRTLMGLPPQTQAKVLGGRTLKAEGRSNFQAIPDVANQSRFHMPPQCAIRSQSLLGVGLP